MKFSPLSKKVARVGIFGACFNPLHLAHLNVVVRVQEAFDFDLLKVVPAYQSPFDSSAMDVSPEKRLFIVRKIFKEYSFVEVDAQEIKRKGISYTIDTINQESQLFSEIFFILGIDQFVQFDKWKNYEEIIKKSHLIICSRGGFQWEPSTLPEGLKKYVLEFQKNKIKLKTKKIVYWLKLNNMDISSSYIRACLAQKKLVSHLLPPAVNQWIERNKFYQKDFFSVKRVISSKKRVEFCAKILLDKKAEKVKAFDLRKNLSLPFDFALLASGLNIRHTKILATSLQSKMNEFFFHAQYKEGENTGQWIVLDYGDFLVHIFYDYTREKYNLEKLWEKAPLIEFKDAL